MAEPSEKPGQLRAPLPPNRWHLPAAAAVIVAVAAAVYANSFAGVFVFDDQHAILDNLDFWRNASLWEIFSSHGQTPVMELTLVANSALSGTRAWGYHLVNLAIHVLAALTLFGIVRRTLLTERLRARLGPAATPLAAAVALVWTAHPIQTEAVTYIIQRKESLMALCYLVTLYCFIRADGSPHRPWWLGGAALACLLGMGTKQVMVTAPVMVLLYDRTFLSGSFRKALARSWVFYILLAGTWAMLASSFQRLHQEGLGVEEVKLGPLVYARTQFGVVLHYLRLCFWPAGLSIDYGDWPVARSAGAYLLPAAIVLALAAAAAMLLWRGRAAGFLGAWFFLILAPTSSIIVITELVVEHRLYLPSAAIAALVVLGGYSAGDYLLRRLSARQGLRRIAGWAAGAAGAAIVCALGCLTVLRNADYRSEFALWGEAIRRRPGSPRGHYNFGMVLANLGRLEGPDGAISEFTRAIELSSGLAPAYNSRGLAYGKLGRRDLALADLTRAAELGLPEGFNNLGNARQRLGQHEQAIRDYTRAIELQGNSAEAYHNRGAAYESIGELDRALQDYSKALELRPRYAEALHSRGKAYGRDRQYERAVADFTRAIELKGDFLDAYYDRGLAWGMLGQYDRAIRDCTSAIQLKGDYAEAYCDRAVSRFHVRDYAGAWADVDACRRLGYQPDPGFVQALSAAAGRPP